jgi:hypothetical protein
MKPIVELLFRRDTFYKKEGDEQGVWHFVRLLAPFYNEISLTEEQYVALGKPTYFRAALRCETFEESTP